MRSSIWRNAEHRDGRVPPDPAAPLAGLAQHPKSVAPLGTDVPEDPQPPGMKGRLGVGGVWGGEGPSFQVEGDVRVR